MVIVDEFTGRLMSGPALVGRPAPGGRSEGRRADPAREPDARLDHVPELFPHVRQARRHDRHGGHRGVRVPADLQPRDGRHPDAPADGPQGRERPGLPHGPGKGRCDHRRHQGLPRARPAGAGRHDLDREFRAAVAVARQGEAAAPGAERQAARARGGDRRAGRPAEDDHHRHQHGGPRHRHRARRQRSSRTILAIREDETLDADRQGARDRQAARRMAGAARRGHRRRRPAHHRHRAPRIAPHRQPAARPFRPPGRSRARRASICRSRIRCCAFSPASGCPGSCSG